MADVFLSYAREDSARAAQVANALQAAGIDVFWDSEIPPGQTWADYIETKLSQCKALIVLWSEHSTKSQWVREEARMGRDKGVLIPAMIDSSQSPFGFGEVQAANLASWNGEAEHPDWRRFLEAVRGATNRPASAASPRPQPAMSAPPRDPAPPPAAREKKGGIPGWAWAVGGVVATIIVLGVIGMNMDTTTPTQPVQTVAQTPQVQQPTAPPVQGQSYQDQILQRLGQVEQAFASQGYAQMAAPVTGQLNQGAAMTHPVTMNVGGEYQIIGVCDNDCADLDLQLLDGYGNVISQDQSTDATPVVSVIPTSSGQFTVNAHMFQCSVQPCYYALVMYARPMQQ
ncbi:hypothetical protein U91I_04066 [alpha proteobacterium U9-1i]|nr:hypothetical protein U91I_04066 [alpha proteobacterium U9-1i]